jgi:hypothetical protein
MIQYPLIFVTQFQFHGKIKYMCYIFMLSFPKPDYPTDQIKTHSFSL